LRTSPPWPSVEHVEASRRHHIGGAPTRNNCLTHTESHAGKGVAGQVKKRKRRRRRREQEARDGMGRKAALNIQRPVSCRPLKCYECATMKYTFVSTQSRTLTLQQQGKKAPFRCADTEPWETFHRWSPPLLEMVQHAVPSSTLH
jgi:hypothetical protein